jgi:hypothetical protein
MMGNIGNTGGTSSQLTQLTVSSLGLCEILSFCFVFLFLTELGFELKFLCLLGKHSTT